MTLKVGFDFKLYFNTGTDASPTYVEIDIAGDVSVGPLGFSMASVPIRSTPWSLRLPTRLQEAAFEFTIAYKDGDTAFDALRALAITTVTPPPATQFAAVSGDISLSGTEGMKAFGVFESFAQSQPLDDLVTHDCTVPFTYTEEASALVEPTWNVTA